MGTNIRIHKQQLAKPLLIATITLLLGACASNSAPTHRWASTEDADKARYAADHARCQNVAQISSEQRKLDTASDAFQSYKQCMNDNGYVLTAYSQ